VELADGRVGHRDVANSVVARPAVHTLVGMNETRVSSWNELQEALFADAWNPEIRRFRSKCAYRGLSDASYPLATTLIRLGGDYPVLEKHLLRNFRKYAHRSMVERDSFWHWAALAKHHGLPARLMDWTYSPYVALHFATANIERYDVDAAIWSVNYAETHRLLPEVLRSRLEHEGANVFTVEMLAQAVPTMEEFAALAPEDMVLFFEPPSVDDRIVNQFAFFSVVSNPEAVLDSWLEKRPHLWRKIVIPAALKWEVRDKLDQGNITERVLFPGLDGLGQWLSRHYSPRPPDHWTEAVPPPP
jgi:hypothetical protein